MLRKVDIIANFFERTVDKTLKTNARWRDVYGCNPKIIPQIVQEHWIVALILVAAAIIGIVSSVRSFLLEMAWRLTK